MKIDYDVGDLIESVRDSEMAPHLVSKGQVFTCLHISDSFFTDKEGKRHPCLGVKIEVRSPSKPGTWIGDLFRKLPKKSLEFFTGENQKIKEVEHA